MNVKNLLLVPGILALTLSSLPVLPVAAQTTPSVEMRSTSRLNLTDAQKTQMKQLRQETQAQIEQILTADQKAQLQSLKQNGKMRGGMKSLNLSEAQKQQMRQIRESSKQKMLSILSPEQRELMQQKRQGAKQSRQRGQLQQPVQPQ